MRLIFAVPMMISVNVLARLLGLASITTAMASTLSPPKAAARPKAATSSTAAEFSLINDSTVPLLVLIPKTGTTFIISTLNACTGGGRVSPNQPRAVNAFDPNVYTPPRLHHDHGGRGHGRRQAHEAYTALRDPVDRFESFLRFRLQALDRAPDSKPRPDWVVRGSKAHAL